MTRIAIGFVLSFVIGAGCRYFDIPAASPPVIPGALIVLAMTLGYSSMDRVLVRRDRVATTKDLVRGADRSPEGLDTLGFAGALEISTSPRKNGKSLAS
jgi:XapX domain-containing protein